MRQLFLKTMTALLWEAAERKASREKPRVIALTGSVGKTSAKEAIAAVLEQSGRPVVKTAGNLNTEVGVPLSLLGFASQPSGLGGWLGVLLRVIFPPRPLPSNPQPYYVLEYSADRPGDIPALARRFPLALAILTRIAPAHMQSYPTFEDLVREKSQILTGLSEQGVAVLNADDPAQQDLAPSGHECLRYGIKEEICELPGVWARQLRLTDRGLACQIDFVRAKKMDSISRQQLHSMTLQTALTGRHQLYALLAAAAVGFQEGVSFAKMKKALEAYQLPAGRGRLIEGQKEILIVDDTYNSSPEAVRAGLQSLRPLAEGGKRRVVAILGSMNELGEMTESAHEEVGRMAAETVDFLAAVGPHGERMRAAAEAAGLAGDRTIAFSTPEQLMDKLEQLVQRQDLVYVKASQNGMRLERVVRLLMAHPEEAEKLLVRQSAYWRQHP